MKSILDGYIDDILHSTSKNVCQFSHIPIILQHLDISKNCRTVIVSGTNGKGSTVSIIESILLHNLVSCVVHTSPHVVIFNERIRHNGKAISDSIINPMLIKLSKVLTKLNIKITYHLIAFFCSCMLMDIKKPEWFILEVGLGGRLDPANVFNADISILTCVDFDHTDTLGDNLPVIGLEKSHIARSNKIIMLGTVMPSSVTNYLNSINSIIRYSHFPALSISYTLPKISIACALEACSNISSYYGKRLTIPSDIINRYFFGRIQLMSSKPQIIVDVAHNKASVCYLFEKIRKDYSYRNCIALFTALNSKDFPGMFSVANKYVSKWFIPNCVEFDKRFIKLCDIKSISCISRRYTYENLNVIFDQISRCLKVDDLLVVFGSFILAGEFIKFYRSNNDLFQSQ